MKNTLVLVSIASLALLSSCAVKPKASFSTLQQKVAAPATVQFANTSVKADKYEWDFGDGTATSTDANPTHRYMHSGNFNVVLKATAGNKTTTHKQIMQVTAPERCLIEIQTTHGNMIAELYSATPQHRDNFVKLAEEGYYDDLLFHRVIAGFMVQGGDPNSRGAKAGQQLGFGGPSYKVPAEFVDSLVHVKGSLAAARDGNPQKASSASQFYIVQGSGPIGDDQLNMLEAQKGFRYSTEQREAYKSLGGTPFLDRDYTVFGRIVEGLEIVDKIAGAKTGPNDRPVEDVKMKIRVIK